MILRLSYSLSRALVVIASFLMALWLSFFGIRAAVAQYGAEGHNVRRLEMAVRLEPGNPAYWYYLGHYRQYNFDQPDAAVAEESYRKAIALNPLDTNAWLDLGTAYELEGRNAEAHQAYLSAKKSHPVSADVSWRYGNFLLREGDRAQAYKEMRRAIEADPQLASMAFSRAYRANPDIDEIMAQLLPPNPSAYVYVIDEARSEKQLAAAEIVWARLLTLRTRLAMRDFDHLVSDLVAAREFSEARRIWDQGVSTTNLPPLFQPPSSVVWDPSFESGIRDNTFSWHFRPIVQGVNIGLDKTEKHSGSQSLLLGFDGKHNPNLEAACTIGVVQPGTPYHFSGWIKTKAISTEYGIGFQVRSLEEPTIAGVSTREVHGTNPWTLIEETWTAGPYTHRASVCITRYPSDNPEVRISGTAWVDDVNLVPQPTERRPPERHKP